MSANVSWGMSLGSQSLAELSLLEAKAQQVDKKDDSSLANIMSASSSLIVSTHENDFIKNNNIQLQSNEANEEPSVCTNSPSLSLADLIGSESEAKAGTPSNLETRPNSLSVLAHIPLSCSTPLTNAGVSLRRASLRSSSALKLQIENWGLPSAIVQKYAEKKITSLFPWQVECLQTKSVLSGGNLIYSAPTSSGKTLVSELLLLKTAIELKKKGNIYEI